MRRSNYMNRLAIALIFLSFLNFSACLAIHTHPKGIEPSAHPLASNKYEVVEPTEFKISSFRLFWFFPVTPGLRIYETIDDVVSKKGADNLIEMQLWHERQYWILGTVDIVHVRGKIIRYTD